MKKNVRNIAIGTAVAATVGYVAGILTAPKKGSDTRKDIVKAGLKTKAQAERQFKKLNTELTNTIKQVEELVKKTKSLAKSKLPGQIKDAQKAKTKIREIISGLHEGDAVNEDLKQALEDGQQSISHLRKFLDSKNPIKTKSK